MVYTLRGLAKQHIESVQLLCHYLTRTAGTATIFIYLRCRLQAFALAKLADETVIRPRLNARRLKGDL